MKDLDRLLREAINKDPEILESLSRELLRRGYGMGDPNYKETWDRILTGEVSQIIGAIFHPRKKSKVHLVIQSDQAIWSGRRLEHACSSCMEISPHWEIEEVLKKVPLNQVCKSCLRAIRARY